MQENSIWKNAIQTITQEDCKNLTPGTQYDLSGFVNSEVKMHLRNYGNSNAVFFRVPVITYDQMQFVVDIWSTSRDQEPRFHPNWQVLQFTIIRGAEFKEVVTNYGLKIYVFKINAWNQDYRFIWMSHPCRNFWQDPVENPEDAIETRQWVIQRHDRQGSDFCVV